MRIDVSGPEGNIFTALGIARNLMRKAHRDKAAIEAMSEKVMGAASYKAACEAITEATFGSIIFYDPKDED